MKTHRVDVIIHLFAFLHVAVALMCRSFDIMDEIWLTLLSITMVVLICVRMFAKVELIVATVIVINFAGYMLGVYGAKLISCFIGEELAVHAISTFITTEIIGWGTYSFLNLLKRNSASRTFKSTPPDKISNKHVIWLAGAIIVIILFRILLTFLFSSDNFSDGSLLRIVSVLFSKYGILLIMLGLIIILVRQMRLRCGDMPQTVKTVLIAVAAVALSALAALIAGINIGEAGYGLTVRKFSQFFFVSLAFFLIFYSIVYMVDYAFATRAAMYAEKKKAVYARFQYEKLKQQVNPHFLFNSLNILDCLVAEGKNERASIFIHKLAGIYRYLLASDAKTVPLKNEMNFVDMYVDLMKERFADGFEVTVDIPGTVENRHVIPCSVQMLIENAIKHNRVGGDSRLEIRVSAGWDFLTVTNNLLPKLSQPESTKVGLNYMHKQYMNLCNRGIAVTDDGREFKVSIPLI